MISPPSDFVEWLTSEVVELAEGGIEDFSHLTSTLPGVYPSDIADVLRSLCKSSHDPIRGMAARLLMSSSTESKPNSDPQIYHATILPPHPLDYEWRFSPEAVRLILERVSETSPNMGAIACVATPSVVIHGDYGGRLNIRYFGRDVRLIEPHLINKGICGIHLDLSQEPDLTATHDVVVMDPPWYGPYMIRFLWAASKICKPNGILLLSLPAKGTRPGICNEIDEYRAWWESLGFVEEVYIKHYLPYETPYFEKNSLRAAGILNVDPTWRRGDFVQLRLTAAREVPWPGDINENQWKEFIFGRVRIRVNHLSTSKGGSALLKPIVEGDVLPTVSRRDSRRALAKVWSCGNRVFDCENPKALIKIMKLLLESGFDGSNFDSLNCRIPLKDAEHLAISQIADIVRTEHNEMSND